MPDMPAMGESERHDPTHDQHESTPGSSGPDGAAGDMGSSSELVGDVGDGVRRTDGLRDTSTQDAPSDAPPEQTEGGDEPQPEGLEPKAGYPSADPRHARKPYDPTGR